MKDRRNVLLLLLLLAGAALGTVAVYGNELAGWWFDDWRERFRYDTRYGFDPQVDLEPEGLTHYDAVKRKAFNTDDFEATLYQRGEITGLEMIGGVLTRQHLDNYAGGGNKAPLNE